MTTTARPRMITAEQIRALRSEAWEFGDPAMVETCTRALAGDAAAVTVCARVIAAARAMMEDE